MDFSFSVVIPCRNEEKYIGMCLDSIFNNKYDITKVEVIVCDGMSDDGTLSILHEYEKKYLSLSVLNNENRTTQFALNMGINKSKNEIVLILGAHSELAENFFSTCNAILKEKPEVMCVGGVLKNICEGGKAQIISGAMSSAFGVGNAHFRTGSRDGEVDTVAFGCYRREVFSRVGLFDEALTRNQDDEFNYRLLKANMKIWLTSATYVKYYVRVSYKKLFKQYYQYGYWKVFVNRKHKTVTTIRQLIPLFFVLFLTGGLIISAIAPVLFKAYLAIVALYLFGAVFFAFKQTKQITSIMGLIMAFLILHISYGWGYLTGIFDFFILRKNPSQKQHQLTR